MGVFEFAAIAVVSMTCASMWKAWTKARVAKHDGVIERRLLALESRMVEMDGLRNEMLLGSRVQVLEELANRQHMAVPTFGSQNHAAPMPSSFSTTPSSER